MRSDRISGGGVGRASWGRSGGGVPFCPALCGLPLPGLSPPPWPPPGRGSQQGPGRVPLPGPLPREGFGGLGCMGRSGWAGVWVGSAVGSVGQVWVVPAVRLALAGSGGWSWVGGRDWVGLVRSAGGRSGKLGGSALCPFARPLPRACCCPYVLNQNL